MLEWLGIDDSDGQRRSIRSIAVHPSQILIYARVSSHKQSKGINEGSFDNDLGRQIERLKKSPLEKYKCSSPVIYSDTFSGLFHEEKLCFACLNDILKGKFNQFNSSLYA